MRVSEWQLIRWGEERVTIPLEYSENIVVDGLLRTRGGRMRGRTRAVLQGDFWLRST